MTASLFSCLFLYMRFKLKLKEKVVFIILMKSSFGGFQGVPYKSTKFCMLLKSVLYLRVLFYYVIKNVYSEYRRCLNKNKSKSFIKVHILYNFNSLNQAFRHFTHFNYARFQRISWRKQKIKIQNK